MEVFRLFYFESVVVVNGIVNVFVNAIVNVVVVVGPDYRMGDWGGLWRNEPQFSRPKVAV